MLGVGLVERTKSRLDPAPRNAPMPRMLARLYAPEPDDTLVGGVVPLAIDVALLRLAARLMPPPPHVAYGDAPPPPPLPGESEKDERCAAEGREGSCGRCSAEDEPEPLEIWYTGCDLMALYMSCVRECRRRQLEAFQLGKVDERERDRARTLSAACRLVSSSLSTGVDAALEERAGLSDLPSGPVRVMTGEPDTDGAGELLAPSAAAAAAARLTTLALCRERSSDLREDDASALPRRKTDEDESVGAG